MKSWPYITIILSIIVFSFLGYYFFQPESKQEEISHDPCLLDEEIADYLLNEKYAKEAKIPKIPIVISVREKDTNKEKFSFQIDNVDPAHYHPIELHKCGIYVVRKFNYDPEKTKQEPGFRAELWKYQYNGRGNSLLLLAEKDEEGIFKSNYSYDFRIDPTESYVFLVRSYLGQPDYALVIKDLKTMRDRFVLAFDELLEQYPNIQPGSFGLGIFTSDNKYYWGDIYWCL